MNLNLKFSIVIVGMLLTFFALLYTQLTLHWIICLLIAVNITALILCGYDKSIAGSRSTRVPEIILWGLAFFGGSPGLILGMKLFRHKTQKSSFQFMLFVIVVLQVGAWRYFVLAR